MNSFSGKLKYVIILAVIVPALSCCRKNAPQKQPGTTVIPSVISLNAPESNKVVTCGDPVKISYTRKNQDVRIDSVIVFEGRNQVMARQGDPGELEWNSGRSKMGQNTLRVQFYYNDSLKESHNVNVIVLSDIVPVNYSYSVVAKYPHDNQAYTQGLVYDGGYLLESTGLEGKSTLRVVDIKSGKTEKLVSLAPKFFGEGIALLNDNIYQVTYKNQVGFVYDKNTLSQIRSFDYQFREGWGLGTDGTHLIMSDGTSQLFFIEPEYFTQVDQIRVFDNKGMIDSLNEIEYINGKILSNIYGESYIVIIEPTTGKVIGKVDFSKLVPEGYQNNMGYVLNGIAWNPSTGNLYITGKNWPVLYEVKLTPSL